MKEHIEVLSLISIAVVGSILTIFGHFMENPGVLVLGLLLLACFTIVFLMVSALQPAKTKPPESLYSEDDLTKIC